MTQPTVSSTERRGFCRKSASLELQNTMCWWCCKVDAFQQAPVKHHERPRSYGLLAAAALISCRSHHSELALTTSFRQTSVRDIVIYPLWRLNEVCLTRALDQWLKCNGMRGNALSPPLIYGSKRSPSWDYFSAMEWHATTDGDPNLNVPFPQL